MKKWTSLPAVALVALSLASARAENWPSFRGPNFNGSTSETNLPTQWSTTENVAWSVDLPGPSAATPVVWEDRVFVSSTDVSGDTLLAMCFDRKTGKKLWQHQVASGVRKDTRSTFAAPSPATDGNTVVFFYGSGELVAVDLDGNPKWKRNLGPFAFGWTFSTSPVIFDGKLYMQILQRDVPVDGRGLKDRKNESTIQALDPETGKTIWSRIRPSKAVAESREAFTTPMPYVHGDRRGLLVAGGDALSGHDLDNGEELWRWGTWNPTRIGSWRLVPSPIAGDGIVLACAPKRSPIYAIRLGGKGVLTDDAIAWISEDERVLSSDVPTPAFYDGDFFILSDVRKSLSRVAPKSGKIKWSITTPGRTKYEASPLAADGKIYLINFAGEVAIVDAADGKPVNVIPMETGERTSENVRSSVIAAQGQLFVRANRKLYCIGK